MVLGPLMTFIRTAIVSYQLNMHHRLQAPASLYSHPMETLMMNALRKPGLYVHWGVYMSGKSRAALNAGLRLQQQEGHLVILLHGFDFPDYKDDMRSWLWHSIRLPRNAKHPISKYLQHQAACIIIDHAEWCIRIPQKRDDLLQALRETGLGVLLIVSSWEHAVELRDAGCKLLGPADCGRWQAEHLEELQQKLGKAPNKEAMRLSILSGTPLYMIYEDEHDGKRDARRALLQDAEWCKGVLALEQGVVLEPGTFPDKTGIFHWP